MQSGGPYRRSRSSQGEIVDPSSLASIHSFTFSMSMLSMPHNWGNGSENGAKSNPADVSSGIVAPRISVSAFGRFGKTVGGVQSVVSDSR
jgi:hypothetical protein